MKKQPKLDIGKDQLDINLEYIAFFAIGFLFITTLFFYGKLPDQIPIHFNVSGHADSYGNKMIIWLLPLIGLLIICGLHYLNKFPHTFNYLTKITNENAHDQYKIATRMMRSLNLIIGLMFCYIQWATIQVALTNWTGLGSGFLIVSLCIMFGTITYFMIQGQKQSVA